MNEKVKLLVHWCRITDLLISFQLISFRLEKLVDKLLLLAQLAISDWLSSTVQLFFQKGLKSFGMVQLQSNIQIVFRGRVISFNEEECNGCPSSKQNPTRPSSLECCYGLLLEFITVLSWFNATWIDLNNFQKTKLENLDKFTCHFIFSHVILNEKPSFAGNKSLNCLVLSLKNCTEINFIRAISFENYFKNFLENFSF